MTTAHVVQFYDNDTYLIDGVSSFLRAGFEEDATAIVVATEAKREKLCLAFKGNPAFEDRLVSFDASEVLAAFIVDGRPDKARFERVLGRIIEQAAQTGPVRIFGEMVAVLWAGGDVRGAVHLEELWNGLAKQQIFSLLCAYPLSLFSDRKGDGSFLQICRAHTQIRAPASLIET